MNTHGEQPKKATIEFNLTLTIKGDSLDQVDSALTEAAGQRLIARMQNPPNINGMHVSGAEMLNRGEKLEQRPVGAVAQPSPMAAASAPMAAPVTAPVTAPVAPPIPAPEMVPATTPAAVSPTDFLSAAPASAPLEPEKKPRGRQPGFKPPADAKKPGPKPAAAAETAPAAVASIAKPAQPATNPFQPTIVPPAAAVKKPAPAEGKEAMADDAPHLSKKNYERAVAAVSKINFTYGIAKARMELQQAGISGVRHFPDEAACIAFADKWDAHFAESELKALT